MRNLVAFAAAVALVAACRREPRNPNDTSATAGAQSTTPASAAAARATNTSQAVGDSGEAGGDVVAESTDTDTMPTERWLSDANVLSLLSLMNARQIAAAEIEFENWHLPGIRDFALSMLRDHTSLQRSIDSASERLKIPPIRPALADRISIVFQAQLDTMLMRGRGGAGNLDRAFVAQQISSHALMASYIQQLAGVAESVELQNFLGTVSTRVAAELSQSRAMQTRPASLDSISTDSLKRRDSVRIKQPDSARVRPDSIQAKPDPIRPKPDPVRTRPDSIATKPDSI